MAQLVERLIRNQQIVSSNLTGGSIRYKGLRRRYLRKPFFFFFFFFPGRRMQAVTGIRCTIHNAAMPQSCPVRPKRKRWFAANLIPYRRAGKRLIFPPWKMQAFTTTPHAQKNPFRRPSFAKRKAPHKLPANAGPLASCRPSRTVRTKYSLQAPTIPTPQV